MELHEEQLLPPDTPLNDKELSGSFAIINLAIQDQKMKTRKEEKYDRIGLDISFYSEGGEETINQTKTITQQPKQESVPGLEKKRKTITPQPNKKKVEPVTFRPQTKKKPILPDKKKPVRLKTLIGKTSEFNKLYEM